LCTSDSQWFDGSPVSDADARALDPERVAKRKEAEEQNAALVKALVEGAPESDLAWRELAGQLVDFHRRGAKPEWWDMFTDRTCRREN
jgi:uncharacterized protein